jgi:hypothetical protein
MPIHYAFTLVNLFRPEPEHVHPGDVLENGGASLAWRHSMTLDADYLRRQAETCFYLSRATFDLSIAGRLRALAEELRRKATEIELRARDESEGRNPRAAGCRGRGT